MRPKVLAPPHCDARHSCHSGKNRLEAHGGERPVYAIERRLWLIEQARKIGRLDVSTMSTELGLAPETIRRDLKDLERQGLVRRVYGGAVPVERLTFESALSMRATRRQAEKNRIAEAAASLVKA